MRIVVLFLVGMFVLGGNGVVFGQVEGDTLGLTGTMADTVVANRLFGEMKGLMNAQKWTEAEITGWKAKDIYAQNFGEKSRQVGDIWYKIGEIGYNQKDYEKSISFYQKSLENRLIFYGEADLKVANTYINLGVSFNAKGLYDNAIECLGKGLDIQLKILGLEHLNVAVAYFNLGVSYGEKLDYDKAIYYRQKALDIRVKILGLEHPIVAYSFSNLGNAYNSKGEYGQAIANHKTALRIRLKFFGTNHPDVARSYINLGNSYSDIGDDNQALIFRQKALSVFVNTLNEEDLETAIAFNNLGNSYKSIGDYEKSILYHQKSLNIRLKKLKPEHPDIATSYYNIGNVYRLMNEYDKAIEYQEKALNIRLKTIGLQHHITAGSYNSIGSIYHAIGNYEKAIEFQQTALDIRLKTLGLEHPSVALSLNNLGIIYKSKGDYKKAIECNQKALEIRLKTLGSVNLDVALSYQNLADIYSLERQNEKAIEYNKKALIASEYKINAFKKITSIDIITTSLKSLCSLSIKQFTLSRNDQQLQEGYELLQQIISAVEYQNAFFSSDDSKGFWQNKNFPIYELAISVVLLKAKVDCNNILLDNTFTYAEKSKASLLQAQIKATDAINFSGIPDSLLEKEHNLRIDISWREKQHQSLLDKGLSETDTNTLRISSIIFDLKQQYETLKHRFETEYPEYYRLKYDLSTVSLQYVQDTLLQPKNQALLEYFVGDSSIYLFLVRPDTLIIQEVKRDFPLEAWIEGLRYGIYGHYAADKAIQTDSLKADAKRAYLEFAPKLYQKLVAPIAQHLPQKVFLVPDGPLGYVPFDALLTAAPEDANNFKSYPYLIQKHQFSYTYSATLLREMRDKKHRQKPKKDFVAFAPFYNGDTTLLANMYAYDDLMRKDLQPLAFSGPEVAAASKLMHGETVAGTAATEEKFTSIASDYRIIHLATHGRADNRVGDYAFLAFTEIKDSLENELLYVKDLYNLQLNADLVVLSACETGIGKLQRGEGIISLARAFAYAGAKSIVTSLWSVNDKSTSELMRLFYRELQQGKDKDEALRLARLRFLKESSVRNAHPFFWAAFVPLGDMRAVR